MFCSMKSDGGCHWVQNVYMIEHMGVGDGAGIRVALAFRVVAVEGVLHSTGIWGASHVCLSKSNLMLLMFGMSMSPISYSTLIHQVLRSRVKQRI